MIKKISSYQKKVIAKYLQGDYCHKFYANTLKRRYLYQSIGVLIGSQQYSSVDILLHRYLKNIIRNKVIEGEEQHQNPPKDI